MHFVKAFVSAVAICMPLAATAAPIVPKEAAPDELVKHGALPRRELVPRQGNTCAFGGNRLCTSRVRLVSAASNIRDSLTYRCSALLVATEVVSATIRSRLGYYSNVGDL